MTESSAPKRRTSQRVTGKPTGGTPAASGAQRPAGPALPDLLRDLSDLVEALRHNMPDEGTPAHRLLAEVVAAGAISLALRDVEGLDVSATRLVSHPFASYELDITVASEKDADALLDFLKVYGRRGEPTYVQQVLPHWRPPQLHQQWEVTWRGLNLRIGTVVHPDDAVDEPHTARLPHPTGIPETPEPAATADEGSTAHDPEASAEPAQTPEGA